MAHLMGQEIKHNHFQSTSNDPCYIKWANFIYIHPPTEWGPSKLPNKADLLIFNEWNSKSFD